MSEEKITDLNSKPVDAIENFLAVWTQRRNMTWVFIFAMIIFVGISFFIFPPNLAADIVTTFIYGGMGIAGTFLGVTTWAFIKKPEIPNIPVVEEPKKETKIVAKG